jgi:hypothetical protein
MVNNGENILVEFDYQNISVIDPNKVIDEEGRPKERLIDHENLVFYANLECSVLPRTKLALGVPLSDSVRTISVGKINFLNPGFKKFLDNGWSDELTGKNTLKGEGVNQPRKSVSANPDNNEDFYFSQSLISNGVPGAVDNGLLGITQINYTCGLDFVPTIDITLEDVKGRSLFEGGNNSPYAAFFQFPYPLFYLTIKGYLGKAVRLPLMLEKFGSSFDPSTGNFRVRLEMKTYKYTIMSHVSFGAMMGTPLMYKSIVSTKQTQPNNSTNNSTSVVKTFASEGYQKMKELYSEYKSKGLIDDNFPEITIQQLKYRLDRFIKNIIDSFKKTNLNVLNDLNDYTTQLTEYEGYVFFYTPDSWMKTYLDQTNVYILKDSGNYVYQWKKEYRDDRAKQVAPLNELNGYITKFNLALANNKTLGVNQPNYIPNKIDLQSCITKSKFDDININKTYYIRTNKELPGNPSEVSAFTKTLRAEFQKNRNFQFDGKGYFLDFTKSMQQKYQTVRQKIEEGLTAQLADQMSNNSSGIGFTPTMRNILAVFFAQGEAFLRLMDDVHTKAWNLREDPYRKDAVFGSNSTVPSVDIKGDGVENTPIYPWPQLIVENTRNDGGEKYELKYPGDPVLASKLRAFVPEIWPEVEFVEEFIKGYTERELPIPDPEYSNNGLTRPNRFSFNAIEFPISNQVFQNTEEVKFFYEIYERLMLNSFYSLMSRDSSKIYNMSFYSAEAEVTDIIQALSDDNPFLTKKLKEYNINSQVYLGFLRHISNQGEGQSWQNFIRGEFNTTYIKNETINPFELLDGKILGNEISQPNVGLENSDLVEKYIGVDNVPEKYDICDLYPLTNLTWDKDYLANGTILQNPESVYKTSDVLKYNLNNKSIVNFNDTQVIKPITNLNYIDSVFNQTVVTANLKLFYQNRQIKNQFITEGNVFYKNYNNNLISDQTTSMLNTPYFINAIQKGVYNFRYNSGDLAPYKLAAYLFLNSLPLATLKERYKLVDDTNNTTNELSYIMSTIKKFGAIHKLPYAWVVKYGSLWHRYKTWVDTGNDILTDVWQDFNYSYNYDPVNSATTKVYNVTLNGTPQDIVLEDNVSTTIGVNTFTKTIINNGFYPKTLDDFNVFYQGRQLFETNVQIIGTCAVVNDNQLEVLSVNSNEIINGMIISGSGLQYNTTIVSQVSGTTGGVGRYNITPNQLPNGSTITLNLLGPTINFLVTNPNSIGYTSAEIQLALNTKLNIVKTTGSLINEPNGFDIFDLDRSLNLTPWSCYVKTTDEAFVYPLPSFGGLVNQTKGECFNTNGTIKTELLGNSAMYNGSVRLFWKAPNYGYYDNSKVVSPEPDSYLKQIFNSGTTQENFSINSNVDDYSKLDEMFTTFDKDVLDILEIEFLNFSRSVYDYDTIITSITEDETESEKAYKNFQMLMRMMMKVTKPTSTVDDTIVGEIQNAQIESFKTYLSGFMNYEVVMKYGNPSNFNKKLFYTFSNKYIQDPYTYQGYKQSSPNTLPNGILSPVTLAQSKASNPQTWKTLETYVGFSEIPQLQYKNTGSYITDFFIDLDVQFNEKNVIEFAPIIKIYATQKLNNPNITKSEFYSLMNDYLNKNEDYIDTVLDLELTRLRNKLPNVIVTPDRTSVKSDLQGEQSRYELWDTFKSINDKFISGNDYKTKTLFEDILLFDRASRDVGQRIYVDIFKVKDLIEYGKYSNSMLDMVTTILTENNFTYFTMPAYANFYNVQDVSKNPTPNPEGTLEFANSLFGTFLSLDYRDTTSKFLCLYANKPSEHLALNDNVDYRFRDDAFDLRRASDNPLLDNLNGKTDWDKSNKVVGFNVDIGPQNQQIFKQFDISQDPGMPTTESLEVLNQMANLNRNRSESTQSVSLYNLYRNRSYKCNIDMLGNAMIQPMMYFNLRNVPMFSGPYMIMKVSHRISENGFDTEFEGQRQPFYSIPAIDKFLQSLNTKILETIKDQIQKEEAALIESEGNILQEQSDIVNNANNGNGTLTTNQNCSDKLNSSYVSYTNETPVKTTLTLKNAIDIIKTEMTNLNITTDTQPLMLAFLFSVMYIDSYKSDKFESYGYNYGSIRLDVSYGGASALMSNSYYCVNQGTTQNIPLAIFSSDRDFVRFAITKFKEKLSYIKNQPLGNDDEQIKALAKTFILRWPVNQPDNVYDKMTEQDKKTIENKFRKAFDIVKTIK